MYFFRNERGKKQAGINHLFLFVYFIFMFSKATLLVGDTNEIEKFVGISKHMEQNFSRIIEHKTAKVIYLIRERTPFDQQKIDEANRMVDEHIQKLKKDREDFIKENGNEKVIDDESFDKYLHESQSRFSATLTATERFYLSAYYYKEGKVRKEELLFSDTRPLPEVLDALQVAPDTIKGMVDYSINDNDFFSRWGDGTHPLDTTVAKRNEHTASVILDQQQASRIRMTAELGLVRRSTPESLQFLKFGTDFISPAEFLRLEEKTKIPFSLSEHVKDGERLLRCLFGKNGENEVSYEIDLFPDKNYVIKSMKLLYNNFVTLDYEFSSYVEAEPGIWIPKHAVLKNRVLGGDIADAFHVTEFMAVEPLQLGIVLDDKLFEIHLTENEKSILDRQDEISVHRKTNIIPENNQSNSRSGFFLLRYIFILMGVLFIFLSYLLRKKFND